MCSRVRRLFDLKLSIHFFGLGERTNLCMYEDPICVSHAKPTVAYGRVSCIARAPAAAVANAIWELQLVKASVPFDY